ncbi:MAG TPA: hypothetical protein DCK93_03440 [Blastocatellia bacterium]|nr:hypothetical protein [Blastocatellia bacterium]
MLLDSNPFVVWLSLPFSCKAICWIARKLNSLRYKTNQAAQTKQLQPNIMTAQTQMPFSA